MWHMVIMGSFGTEGNLGNFLSTQGGKKKVLFPLCNFSLKRNKLGHSIFYFEVLRSNPKSFLSPTGGPEVWKNYSCHCMHHHNSTITHHTTSMNYEASNANSDNIDVNQTDISKNSNRVIAPERSQRTREFDNVLRCVGNWENHPRGE